MVGRYGASGKENTEIHTAGLKRTVFSAALILSSLIAPSASRANQIFTLVDILPDSQLVNISSDGGVTFNGGYAGRYQGQFGSGPNFHVFCVDLNHDVGVGDSYNAKTDWRITDRAGSKVGNYYAGGLASALNPTDYNPQAGGPNAQQRADMIGILSEDFLNATAATFAGGASGSTDLNDNLTAISLSIWDIGQDGADGLAAGTMQGDAGTQASFSGLVNYYEALARANMNTPSAVAWWIQAPRDSDNNHAQDFVFLGPAVPEPGSMAMLVALLLAVGFMRLIRGRSVRNKEPGTEIVPAA
jgi:hypothetical protein